MLITTNMISENLLLSHPIQNIKGPPNVLGLNSHFTNKEISPRRQRVIYLPSSSAEPGRKKTARTMRLMGVFAGRQELWPEFRAQRGLCTDLNSQEAHFLGGWGKGGDRGHTKPERKGKNAKQHSEWLSVLQCCVCLLTTLSICFQLLLYASSTHRNIARQPTRRAAPAAFGSQPAASGDAQKKGPPSGSLTATENFPEPSPCPRGNTLSRSGSPMVATEEKGRNQWVSRFSKRDMMTLAPPMHPGSGGLWGTGYPGLPGLASPIGSRHHAAQHSDTALVSTLKTRVCSPE